MRLFVGQTALKGSFSNYAKKLNFIELQAEPQRLPKLNKLKEMGQEAPDDFRFSVALSEQAMADTDAAKQVLEYGIKVAKAVSPRFLVLRTPPSFRPSTQSEQRLERRVSELASTGFPLAWEPRGVWPISRCRSIAQRLNLQLVQDANDFEPHVVSYLKLAGFGSGQRISEGLLERLAVSTSAASELYLALGAPGAVAARAQLQELFDLYSDDNLDDEDEAFDDDIEDDDIEDDEEEVDDA